MGVTPTYRFIPLTRGTVSNGGGVVWDIGDAVGMPVDQYVEGLSGADNGIGEGTIDPQGGLEWQTPPPQVPPLWQSLVAAAETIGERLANNGFPSVPALALAASGNIAAGAAAVGILPAGISAPFELLMAAEASGTRQRGKRRGGSSELPEERAGRWLESKFKAFFRGRLWLGLKKLLWDPPVIKESNYKTTKRSGLDKLSKWSFAMHGKGRPLTDFMVRAVRKFIRDDWKGSADPRVLEVGAGSGALAKAVFEETGAQVLEIDLFEGAESAGHRMITDMTHMERVRSGGMKVVFSSFAFEYEGLPAAREIFRVLENDGRLVALVHHSGSALARSAPLLDWPVTFLVSFRPLRAIMPQGLIDALVCAETLKRQLFEAAFASQGHARKMLTDAGFVDVTFEVVTEPMFGSKRKDVGWLITARKPGRRK